MIEQGLIDEVKEIYQKYQSFPKQKVLIHTLYNRKKGEINDKY